MAQCRLLNYVTEFEFEFVYLYFVEDDLIPFVNIEPNPVRSLSALPSTTRSSRT